VTFFIEVGVLLVVLPWSDFWERNYFVYAWPPIAPLLASAFVRGAVSGIGLLNLVAGVSEMGTAFSPRE
jgi:hypothetical protein